jgi:LacI family transcriptional regulator
MEKRVTIRDIAAKANVSISLVSFVMNNRIEMNGKQRYRVSETTRKRIMEIARELDYRPNSAARTLRNGRSLVIGVILSDISNVFYGEIARRVEDIAYQRGYTVLFGSTDENAAKLNMLVHAFIDKGVDGFILVPCENSQKSIDRILQANIPLVILDRHDMISHAPTITIDNSKAMEHAVEILLRKHIRRIEMISYTMGVSSIAERENGYMERMRREGVDESEICIHRVPFNNVDEEVQQLIPGIINRKVEGLVFATNTLTIATIRALVHQGIRVQKDIQIVGFDNSDVYTLFTPQIAHIQQPIADICRASCDNLFDLIDGRMRQDLNTIVLDHIVAEDEGLIAQKEYALTE